MLGPLSRRSWIVALMAATLALLAAFAPPALAADADGDGAADAADNCRFVENPDQTDSDGDGKGDVCDGGLVVAWSMDEASGQYLEAHSGDPALDAVLGFGPQTEREDPARIGPGASGEGGALYLDGRSDLATGPVSQRLEPPVVSVVAMVRSQNGVVNPFDHIVSKGLLGSCASPDLEGASFALHTVSGSGGTPRDVRFSLTGQGAVLSSARVPAGSLWDGGWHEVIGTYDGRYARVYLDGARVGTASGGVPRPILYDGAPVVLGNVGRSTNCGFKTDSAYGGSLDQVEIYDCVVTPLDRDCDGTRDQGGASDADGDGDPDGEDNCETTPNPGQTDTDADGVGDACDVDIDGDGVANGDEPSGDADGDGLSGEMDPDSDDDGDPDGEDNCRTTPNPDQTDTDADGVGDACDSDIDGDGLSNTEEGTGDSDGDGTPDTHESDSDNDGDPDSADNCRTTPNPDQTDTDADGVGDACDSDIDGDGVSNTEEGTGDSDGDGTPDTHESDSDNDGDPDGEDNCRTTPNPDQTDTDADGAGDACDSDIDGDGLSNTEEGTGDSDGDGTPDTHDTDSDNDGIPDGLDNCRTSPNTDQSDIDADGIGDVCDPDAGGPGDAGEATILDVDVDTVSHEDVGHYQTGQSGSYYELEGEGFSLDIAAGGSERLGSGYSRALRSYGRLGRLELELEGHLIVVRGVTCEAFASRVPGPSTSSEISSIEIDGLPLAIPGGGDPAVIQLGLLRIGLRERENTLSSYGVTASSTALHVTGPSLEVTVCSTFAQVAP